MVSAWLGQPNNPYDGFNDGQACWSKVYDLATRNLITDVAYNTWTPQAYRVNMAAPGLYRAYINDKVLYNISGYGLTAIQSDLHKTIGFRSYNFMGRPLKAITEEWSRPDPSTASVTRTASVDYAYWGADKYYQQKAVRDGAGRYSFTDYYPNSAAAGLAGKIQSGIDKPSGVGKAVSAALVRYGDERLRRLLDELRL